MIWKIDFYEGVEDEIVSMPNKIQARMLRLLDTMEQHGGDLGEPHTKSLGNGLFEIRAKANEGIGRGMFCYMKGKHIVILRAFVKKTQKTPKKELEIAMKRMKEVKQ